MRPSPDVTSPPSTLVGANSGDAMTVSALGKLQHHMAHAREAIAMDGAPFGRPEAMVRAVVDIRRRVNGALGPLVQRNRIREALDLLEGKGLQVACATHLRFLCWALGETHTGVPALLQRTDGVVGDLLNVIDEALAERTLPLSAWRGLLAAYFAPEIRPTGRADADNWRALRGFLAGSLATLEAQARFTPDWLRALLDHRDILTKQPCERYAAAVFAGQEDILAPLRDHIGVPQTSWFWDELILSQVRHLCRLPDAEYLGAVDRFLVVLRHHPLLADDALTLILGRHHRSLAAVPHLGLQDFATERWGSPHIHAQAKWSLVDPPIKQMVREWIVREDLKLFFDLLSADGATDQRRLDFWLRFAKQIDFAHFALGPAVFDSPRPDYVDMRKRRLQRTSRLTNPGNPDNNAFILKLGAFFFVEFGQTGNAAYGYQAEDLPFRLPTSAINLHEAKNQRRSIFRQPHNGDWEHKFLLALESLGIHPDDDRRAGRSVGPSTPRPTAPPPSTRTVSPPARPPAFAPLPPPDPAPVRTAALRSSGGGDPLWSLPALAIARRHGLDVLDQRPKSGCLWFLTDDATHPARHDLEKLGFRFTEGRGFWRKK